ncbi:MAG TPA: hypothetical protein VEX37_11630 [Thermomicrobiales bacterium]|nr:hypothetical protein [Thermomicrobiales bacterium]
MSTTDSASAFRAMVAQYESRGWEVRTIDQAGQRATVRARVVLPGSESRDLTVQVATTESGCRRLWVDSKGEVQETVVPC